MTRLLPPGTVGLDWKTVGGVGILRSRRSGAVSYQVVGRILPYIWYRRKNIEGNFKTDGQNSKPRSERRT